MKIEKMQAMQSKLKAKKGIALSLELLLVVGVVAIILYVVVTNMMTTGNKLDVASASSQLTQMTKDTQKLYKKVGVFTTVSPTTLLDNKVVPEDMRAGAIIVDSWNGTVAVAPATDTIADDSFTITLPSVPQEVCSGFVTAAQAAFYNISVAGTDVKTKTVPIDPTVLGTQCNAGATSAIIFTAGRN